MLSYAARPQKGRPASIPPPLLLGPELTPPISEVDPADVLALCKATPEMVERLKRLSDITRVPQAVYLREALEDLLRKYASTLRKAAK